MVEQEIVIYVLMNETAVWENIIILFCVERPNYDYPCGLGSVTASHEVVDHREIN